MYHDRRNGQVKGPVPGPDMCPEEGPAIEVLGITKRFPTSVGYRALLTPWRRATRTVLNDVSLRVGRGEVFGLLGHNGAGKTTLLKLMAGLVLPDEGQARIYGCDVVRHIASAKKLVRYATNDERSFFWRLTGWQNLRFFGILNNAPVDRIRKKSEALAELLGMREALNIRVLYFSTGMRHKLALMRALVDAPRVLLLDEPTRSLDAAAAQEVRRFIRDELVGHEGITVVLATHNIPEAVKMCDRMAVLRKGEVVACDTPANLFRGYGHAGQVSLYCDSLPPHMQAKLVNLPGVMEVALDSKAEGDGARLLKITLDNPGLRLPGLLSFIFASGVKVSRSELVDAEVTDAAYQLLR